MAQMRSSRHEAMCFHPGLTETPEPEHNARCSGSGRTRDMGLSVSPTLLSADFFGTFYLSFIVYVCEHQHH